MTPQPQNNPPFGPISGWTWSNGLAHLRAHGLDGEIRRIESAVVQDFDYDPAGRIVGQHLWSQTAPPQPDTLSSFSLDPAGRLTAARTEVAQPQGVVGDSLDYAYDPNGNRQSLAWNNAATRYGYSGNRLAWSSGADNRSYAYDAAGRMTGDGYYTYRYTPLGRLGRLAAINSGGRRIGEYAYNALGQRVSKTGLRFVYDESGHLLGEYDPRGNLVQELVWLDDLPVASLRPDPRGGRTVEIFHIHPDHLGTPRQITDSADRIVWRWDTADPFGNALADDNPDDGKGKKSVFEFNLWFPGQYFDGETGLHYNYYRDYDPSIGRYTTSDPIGLEGGLNIYAYINSNPILRTDPMGLFWGGSTPPSGPIPNPNPTPNTPRFSSSSCGPAGSPSNFPNGMFGQWGFEFACQYHDQCYGTCGTDKGYCDKAFKEIMLWECNKLGDMVSRQMCRNMAQSYYQAVNHGGDDAYNNAQSGCTCKP